MKNPILILLFCALVFTPCYSQLQRTYGTLAYEDAKGIALNSADSGFVMAGRSNTVIFGGTDATVAKIKPNGSLQWSYVYGNAEYDEFNSIREVSPISHVKYIAAGSTKSYGGNQQLYLVGLSPLGIPLFSRTFGGPGSEIGYCIQNIKNPTFGSGYAIVGETTSYPGVNPGVNMYVLLTDQLGNFKRAAVIGSGVGNERGYWIEQTFDGGYIVVGSTTNACASTTTSPNEDIFVARLDFNLNLLWNRIIGGGALINNDAANCVRQNPDGTFIITGRTQNFGAGKDDSFLLKLSAGGGFMWMKTYGYIATDIGRTVLISNTGGLMTYVVSGSSNSYSTTGMPDAMLYKTDAAGNLLWNRFYGGASRDEGFEVVANATPGYSLTGYVSSYGVGSTDISWINTDINGKTGLPCETAPPLKVMQNQPCINASAVSALVVGQLPVPNSYKALPYLERKCVIILPALESDQIKGRSSSLSLHPNPASSELSLTYEKEFEGAIVEIINLQGLSVTRIPGLTNAGVHTFDIANLQKGIYLLRIRKKDGSLTQIRFMKQ